MLIFFDQLVGFTTTIIVVVIRNVGIIIIPLAFMALLLSRFMKLLEGFD